MRNTSRDVRVAAIGGSNVARPYRQSTESESSLVAAHRSRPQRARIGKVKERYRAGRASAKLRCYRSHERHCLVVGRRIDVGSETQTSAGRLYCLRQCGRDAGLVRGTPSVAGDDRVTACSLGRDARAACPSLSETVPRTLGPSLNVTAPVGMPPAIDATVAVKVTDWPNVEGFSDETIAVVVVLIKLAATVCGALMGTLVEALLAFATLPVQLVKA